MTLEILAVHVLLAVATFLVLNWVGLHSASLGYVSLGMFLERDQAPAFNFVFRVVGPIVLMTLWAAILYAADLDKYVYQIWLVVVYYFAGRVVFNLTMSRGLLINWPRELALSVTAILVSWLLYSYFIRYRTLLLPDPNSITNEFWVLVALFVYAILNNVRVGEGRTKRRKDAYLTAAYQRFRRDYHPVIAELVPDQWAESLVYAVLIHESFNRPKVVQRIERLVFPWLSRSLGPMQVKTEQRISDHDSVRIGTELVVKSYQTAVEAGKELAARRGKAFDLGQPNHRSFLAHKVAAEYNRDDGYAADVHRLHELIVPKFYADLTRRDPVPHWTEHLI